MVTDLDGTLLTSDKAISRTTITALTEARALGLRLAIASARPYRLVQEVVTPETLALFSAVIASNGAVTISPSNHDVLHESTMPAIDARSLIEVLRGQWRTAGFGWELGHEFASDGTFLRLAATGTILRDPHVSRLHAFPLRPIHQLVMAIPDSTPRTLLTRVAEVVGQAYAVTDSLGGVVEISSASVSKASAAEKWAHSQRLTLSDAVAFGDEHNDLPLLTRAGTGIAMGNASEEVKAAATVTTLTNDRDGLAVALRHLLSDDRHLEKKA